MTAEHDDDMPRPDLDSMAPRASSLVVATLAKLEARAAGSSPPVPLPWGSVAAPLGGGLWPGLHVVAGAPGSGKTQLTVQVAVHAAKAGTPVLYIALELGRDEMMVRILGAAVGSRWSEAMTGKGDAVKKMRDAGVGTAVPDTIRLWAADRAVTVDRVRSLVADFVDEDDRPAAGRTPPLVVVDYLQRLNNRKAGGAREEVRGRVGQAAYAMRDIARDVDVAVLIVSSVGRAEYESSTKGGRPATDYIGVGKESGDVEYSADTFAALVVGDPERASGRRAHLYLAKVRHGVPTTCDLVFDGVAFSEPTRAR